MLPCNSSSAILPLLAFDCLPLSDPSGSSVKESFRKLGPKGSFVGPGIDVNSCSPLSGKVLKIGTVELCLLGSTLLVSGVSALVGFSVLDVCWLRLSTLPSGAMNSLSELVGDSFRLLVSSESMSALSMVISHGRCWQTCQT